MSKKRETNPILLDDAKLLAEEVMNQLRGVEDYYICGSIRRRREQIHDIDIVLIVNDRSELENSLGELEWCEPGPSGEKKIRIFYKTVQFDFFVAERDRLGAALMYATGDKIFNIAMRGVARSLGFKLNEYGLWIKDRLIAAATEEEILHNLDKTHYLDPLSRNMSHKEYLQMR